MEIGDSRFTIFKGRKFEQLLIMISQSPFTRHGSGQIFERPKTCADPSFVYRKPAEVYKFWNYNRTAICNRFCTVSCKRFVQVKNSSVQKFFRTRVNEVSATRPRRKGPKKLLTTLADLVCVPTLSERSELKGMRKEQLTYI